MRCLGDIIVAFKRSHISFPAKTLAARLPEITAAAPYVALFSVSQNVSAAGRKSE